MLTKRIKCGLTIDFYWFLCENCKELHNAQKTLFCCFCVVTEFIHKANFAGKLSSIYNRA